MKLGLLLGYSGNRIALPMQDVLHAEAAGFDSVWVAEAYGSDAISSAAWILALTTKIKVGTSICQVPARTPAMTAMSAMSLAQLSGDRFILGLGASGPQVVEGWHGLGYERSMERLQECIEIVRLIMARQQPVIYDGEIYQLPFHGQGSTGLGKPLKSILDPAQIPIYTASFTPMGFRMAGQIADGVFPAFASPEKLDLITESVEQGFARSATEKGWGDFDIAPLVHVCYSEDPVEARSKTRDMLALYVGGMGAKGRNFYNNLAGKMGYGHAASEIQNHFLSGRKAEAVAAVPDELIDEISLCGNKAQIMAQAKKWQRAEKNGHVKTLLLAIHQPEMIDFMVDCFGSRDSTAGSATC